MADDGSNLSEASLELAEDEDQPQDEGRESLTRSGRICIESDDESH